MMLDQLLALLRDKERFMLTPHRRPDGDALGSQLALGRFLERLGKQVTMINADPLAHNLSWLPGAEAVDVFDGSLQQRERIGQADVVVVLDTNSEERLGQIGSAVRNSPGIKVLIDHHTVPEDWFDVVYRRESASSTGELIYEIIAAVDSTLLDDQIAAALYTAIMTDTGSFRFSNVSPAVHRIIADLLEHEGVLPDQIHAAVHDTRTLQGLRLMGRALSSVTLHADGLVGTMVLTQRMLEETGADLDDTEGFVNYILTIEGVQVGVLFIETKAGVKISFRSKGDWHVHEWARAFTGGGHRNASGAYQRAALDDVVDQVMAAAPRYLGLDQPPPDGEIAALSDADTEYLSMLNKKARPDRI